MTIQHLYSTTLDCLNQSLLVMFITLISMKKQSRSINLIAPVILEELMALIVLVIQKPVNVIVIPAMDILVTTVILVLVDGIGPTVPVFAQVF